MYHIYIGRHVVDRDGAMDLRERGWGSHLAPLLKGDLYIDGWVYKLDTLSLSVYIYIYIYIYLSLSLSLFNTLFFSFFRKYADFVIQSWARGGVPSPTTGLKGHRL
jgi:hypothetical protein